MSFWERARAKRMLIVGLSKRTGLPAAKLFDQHGVRYRISDSAPLEMLAPMLAELAIAPEDVFAGAQDPAQLDGIDAVLIAPGVPRSIPLLVEAKRRGLDVLVDMDFAYELLAHTTIVGITGTDGKTTTTALTGALLESLGNAVVAGNIGVSVLERLDDIAAADVLVLELSSYMLEDTTRLRPHIAAILNVGEDHVDRYEDMEAYADAKRAIVAHCEPTDVLVFNADDARLRSVRDDMALRPVSREMFHGGAFHVGEERYVYEECGLNGAQNVINILTAVTIAHELGVEPDDIRRVLRSFEGLPHRMEHVGCFGGVDAYNDSKASNAHAVAAALSNFDEGVVLILGGRDKGLDFSILKPQARCLRCLVCYGEDGEKLRAALAIEPSFYTYRFDDAVALAAAQCRSGDVLLMSPGCYSWDQYNWYTERGDHFRELARRHLSTGRNDDIGDAAEEVRTGTGELGQTAGPKESK